jgi:hypothetical protein
VFTKESCFKRYKSKARQGQNNKTETARKDKKHMKEGIKN